MIKSQDHCIILSKEKVKPRNPYKTQKIPESMAKAPGKIILFGEHFVVHGSYAISAAIDRFSEVKVETNKKQLSETKKISVTYNNETVRTESKLCMGVKNILNYLKLNENLNITINSTIKGSGLGSSAAFCVAFAKELNEKFDLKLENPDINIAAYEGEKAFHGNPSGVDNTTSLYEGILLFNKDIKTQLLDHSTIEVKEKIKLILVNTGKKTNTIKIVEEVKKIKELDQEKFKHYIAEINHLVDDAKDAILNHDLPYIGQLMLFNQALLEKIGVSTPEIRTIITTGINNGALGGKITGAGGGGNVILLYDDEKNKEKIINELNNKGYESFSIEI